MKFNNESSIVCLGWRFLGSSVVTEMFRVFEICAPCVFELLLSCYMQDRIAYYFLNLLYLFFLIKMTIIPPPTHTHIFFFPHIGCLSKSQLSTMSLIFPHLLTNFLKCLFSYKYLSNVYSSIDLWYSYRIGNTTIARKVCKAIWFYLKKRMFSCIFQREIVRNICNNIK